MALINNIQKCFGGKDNENFLNKSFLNIYFKTMENYWNVLFVRVIIP